MGIDDELQALADREKFLNDLRELPDSARILVLIESETDAGLVYEASNTWNMTDQIAYYMCGQYMNHLLNDHVECAGEDS